tara:strand:+ start:488 stop:1252 length:765 start_codon:yes stop_codon:yes gene_type:complete
MISVISPAKTLCYDNNVNQSFSYPEFLNKSKKLIEILSKMKVNELSALMKTSEKISELNYQRFKNWNAKFDLNNSKQSIFVFKGDVYIGLDTNTLSEEDLKFSQQNLRILSGLYGILRPLDLMMPYRLEMGTKLKNKIGKNLYDFWGDDITENLNNTLSKHNDKTLVNLASNEYFKSINKTKINAQIINPIFKDYKSGKYKIISFFAKKARGLMSRFIIQNRIDNHLNLKDFNMNGYCFSKSDSDKSNYVFLRK